MLHHISIYMMVGHHSACLISMLKTEVIYNKQTLGVYTWLYIHMGSTCI